MRKNIYFIGAVLLVGLTPVSYADQQVSNSTTTNATAFTSFNPEVFKPRPTRNTRINHDFWSQFLKKTVLVTGASTRQYAKSRSLRTGTRVVFGHKSRLRLEGNKVYFSKFTDAHKEVIGNYRDQLVALANEHDITTFSQDEQLAFWFNLHNATLIKTIADNYPLEKPSKYFLKDQNRSIHDAKLLNIKGQTLSLRDIREKIVYRNWTDPKVIYGFTLGDIGSPSLQPEAFTSDNTETLLAASAEEFINSLRGYRKGQFSRLYEETASFFPSFENDLIKHFNQYMRDDAKRELSEFGIDKTAPYEDDIIDLVGGSGEARQFSNMTMTPGQGRESIPAHLRGTASEFTLEVRGKLQELEKMGLLKDSDVTIEDIPTETK